MAEKITVYEKPTCTTCRNLSELFRANGIEFKRVNYFIDALTEKDLRALLEKANLEPFDVLRQKEPLAKELNLTLESAPDEIIKAIVENPNLLQRPIVEVGDRAVLARPVECALELVKSAK